MRNGERKTHIQREAVGEKVRFLKRVSLSRDTGREGRKGATRLFEGDRGRFFLNPYLF